MSALATVTAFAVGAIAGAVLATLFAPKPGHEVRQDLAERARAFGDRMGFTERRGDGDEAAAH
jgi:gas vesicle protein